MGLVEIFYGIFWVSLVSICWFYTDWVLHYTQLLGVLEEFRIKFQSFIKNNPDKYFPDYLYKLSLTTSNRIQKFVLKLLSCPFCLNFWLSVIAALFFSQNLVNVAPIYVISMLLVLQIKKLL